MATTKVSGQVVDLNEATSEKGLKMPSGTELNRPTDSTGQIRNNTNESSNGSASQMEYYNGTNWKALSNVVRRLHEAMRWRPLQESGAARLVRGSAVVRGWSNYYKIAFNFSKSANWLDHKALWIAVKALCRKFDISTAQCLRKYGRGKNQISINEKYVLKRAQDIPMTWHQDSPQPYEPGTGCYLDDVDWEAETRRYESRRPGCMDLKAFVLFRDGHRCRRRRRSFALRSFY